MRSHESRARERERDGRRRGDGDGEEKVGRSRGGAAGLRVAAEEDHGGAVVELLRQPGGLRVLPRRLHAVACKQYSNAQCHS